MGLVLPSCLTVVVHGHATDVVTLHLPAGLLVAYCHRFDIQVQSSRIYFVACTIAYGLGLLVTFVALVLMQRGQPALLYLVPCTLLTSCTVALWRQELGAFWTGSGFAVNTSLL